MSSTRYSLNSGGEVDGDTYAAQDQAFLAERARMRQASAALLKAIVRGIADADKKGRRARRIMISPGNANLLRSMTPEEWSQAGAAALDSIGAEIPAQPWDLTLISTSYLEDDKFVLVFADQEFHLEDDAHYGYVRGTRSQR